jgi:hypothetical protein
MNDGKSGAAALSSISYAKVATNHLTIPRQLRASQLDLRYSNIHTTESGFRWRVAALKSSDVDEVMHYL